MDFWHPPKLEIQNRYSLYTKNMIDYKYKLDYNTIQRPRCVVGRSNVKNENNYWGNQVTVLWWTHMRESIENWTCWYGPFMISPTCY